jgi:hypothetical protein
MAQNFSHNICNFQRTVIEMFHSEIVGMFMIYLGIKFRMPVVSGSLVNAPSDWF